MTEPDENDRTGEAAVEKNNTIRFLFKEIEYLQCMLGGRRASEERQASEHPSIASRAQGLATTASTSRNQLDIDHSEQNLKQASKTSSNGFISSNIYTNISYTFFAFKFSHFFPHVTDADQHRAHQNKAHQSKIIII